jgi:membrane-associated phospholipid phosphatase
MPLLLSGEITWLCFSVSRGVSFSSWTSESYLFSTRFAPLLTIFQYSIEIHICNSTRALLDRKTLLVSLFRCNKLHRVRTWLLLALLFGTLFLCSFLVYRTGALDSATLRVERWIVGRPLTQFDCVLIQWRNVGAAPATFVLIVLIGTIGALTRRYRWRMLVYLLLLLLFSVIIEEAGKKLFSLPFPSEMRSGMTTLACPQGGQRLLFHLQLALGMWWKAPMPSNSLQDWAHTTSQMPLTVTASNVTDSNSYPSGHATRWWFTGMILAWLWRRHRQPGVGRRLGFWLILMVCFLGASIQFYVGAHFLSDTLAGYLLGTVLGCLAIAALTLNATRRQPGQIHIDAPARVEIHLEETIIAATATSEPESR